MAGITITDVLVKKAIDKMSAMYQNLPLRYEEVAPVIPVANDTFRYYNFDNEEREQGPTEMSDGVQAPLFDWKPTNTSTATCAEIGKSLFIPNRLIENEDSVVDLVTTSISKMLYNVHLQEELKVAAIMQDTSANTVDIAATSQWDTTGGDVEGNINTGIEAVRAASGFFPNTVIIPAAVAAKAISRLKSDAGGLDFDTKTRVWKLPDRLFGLRVVQPGAVYRTSDKGATASRADIWGKKVTILYVSPAPQKFDPSYAYTFRSKDPTVTQEYSKTLRGYTIQVSFRQITKEVSANSRYVLNAVIS